MRRLPARFLLFLIAASLLISSCSHPPAPVRVAEGPPLAWGLAPVKERIAPSRSGSYAIQAGDTLYAIAMVNGLDVEELASWNGIKDPDRLFLGQWLRLTPPALSAKAPPRKEVAQAAQFAPAKPKPRMRPGAVPPPDVKPLRRGKRPKTVVAKKRPPPKKSTKKTKAAKKKRWKKNRAAARIKNAPAPRRWRWPVKGKVVKRFGKRGLVRSMGIDITAPKGTAVRAAADGVVAYADRGVKGYGKLIILRHGGSFLTAYAHNDRILVKRGQSVKAGTRIAKVGATGRVNSPRLHFELRKGVKPINPLRYLVKR